MADAPQVNYAGPWPENDQHRQQWETVGSAENKSKEAALVDQDAYITPSKRRTILGLRRRNFWVLCILAMILVGAIVGGSVGGVSAVQRQNNRLAQTSVGAISAQSFLPSTAITASSTATTSPGALYTPSLPNSDINIDVSCSPQMRSFNGDAFTCATRTDIAGAGDLVSIVAYTVQQCIDACSSMNGYMKRRACVAVAINPEMRQFYGYFGGNCFLKNITGPTTAAAMKATLLTMIT